MDTMVPPYTHTLQCNLLYLTNEENKHNLSSILSRYGKRKRHDEWRSPVPFV